MGIDALSSVAPARVRCLLVPFGRTTRSSFTAFARRLQDVSVVRLGDISPSKAPDSGVFSPLSFPSGSVFYDFADSRLLPSHRALLPFDIHRELLVVLAVSDGKEYDQSAGQDSENGVLHQAVREFSECIMGLQDSYPNALVHRLVLFSFDAEGIKLPSDTVTIPSVEHASATALKTMMADITSTLLEELSALASSIRGLPNVETPRAVAASGAEGEKEIQRHPRPNSRLSMVTDSGKSSPGPGTLKAQHRVSMPPHLSMPDLSPNNSQRSLSGTGTPPSSFDDMSSASARPVSATSETNLPSGERVSVQGFGSGTAGERARNQAQSRVGIVVGSLYLLAGKWPDALKELSNAAASAKANSDYAWYAKALDLLLVALLMHAWAKVEFEIPSVCYPYSDRNLLNRARRSRSLATNGEKRDSVESQSNEANLAALQELSSLIPDLSNNVLHLYARAAEFNASRVPQVIYSETVVRHARILQLIRASGGSLTPPDLQHVIVGSKKPPAVPPNFVGENANCPSRMDVANFVYRALPQPGGEELVETSDLLRIFAGVASVLSDLDFQRKKGLVLRELVATLLPALVQNRKDSAAELGLHPSASFEATSTASYTILGQTHSTSGGVRAFLTLLCDIYGVIQLEYNPTQSVEMSKDESEDVNAISRKALESAVRRTYGNLALKVDILRACINVCEALPDLGGLLQFSSSLLKTAGSGVAPGPATIDSAPSLPIEDQVRLSTNISRAVGAAKQLGIENAEADYWDEFLVRDIGITANVSSLNTPVPRRKADLDLAKATAVTESKDGPFIFNPFAAKLTTASKDILMVVGEAVTFVLLLQNLYDMELEIEWLKFDNDDIAVDASVKDITIGPYRTQNVQVPCTPLKAGKLSLLGCIAKLKGCRPRRFPLFRSPWRMSDPLKLKQHGLSAAMAKVEHPSSEVADGQRLSTRPNLELPSPATFDALIIEAQPTLALQSTSLSQSALMLLDGETRSFSITLKNISNTAVDLFLVSLDDSTATMLQTAASDKSLSPAQLYELELGAQSRPALRVLPHPQGENIFIAPREELILELEVVGKLGLTRGTVNIEYSHLGVPRADIQDRFFTRRLSVAFEVTVNSSLGLLYNDILPLPLDACNPSEGEADMPGSAPDGLDAAQHFYTIKQQWESDIGHFDHCLVMMDFNNAWSEPVAFNLQLQHPTNTSVSEDTVMQPYTLTSVVQPLRTVRVVMPFPKLSLGDAHAPIPSLDPRHKRQYVVSKGDRTRPDAERLARELFWYREEMLKYLQASWTVHSHGQRLDGGSRRGARNGVVDLRRLAITPRMLEALRQDDLVITLNLLHDDKETPVQKMSSTSESTDKSFQMKAGGFLTLETTITSRVSYAVQPLLRLQPALRHQPSYVALDLGRKVAVNGVLQKALPMLHPGQTQRICTGLAFLAPGEYEIAGVVEEVRVMPGEEGGPTKAGQRKRSDTGDLDLGEVGKRTERRAWYSRQACLVDVVGTEEDDG